MVTVTYKESTFHLTPVKHGDLLYSDSEGSKLLVNGKDLNLWMTLEKDRDNKVSIINDVAQVWEQDSPQTHVYRRSFFDAADNSKRTHSQFKFLEELTEMLKKDALPETVEVKFVPKENLTQEYSFNGCLGNACVQTSIDFNNQSYTLSVPNITELYELQTKLGQLLGMSQHEILSKWLVNNGSLLLQGFDLSSLGNSYLDILLIEKSTSSDIRVIRACSEMCLEIKLAVDDKRYTFTFPLIKQWTACGKSSNQLPRKTVLLESYALWMLNMYELEFCSKEKLWKGIAEVERVIGCSGEICDQAIFRLTTEPTNAENIIKLVFRAENNINQTMDILYEVMEDIFDFVIRDDFGEQKQWLVTEANIEESLQVRYRNEWLNRKDILVLVDKQPN
uniref:Uncharacterized protein n=1 Tax=Ditylenchus dipsaci TaxID=166011 RepID=A0A915EBK5_9BILA